MDAVPTITGVAPDTGTIVQLDAELSLGLSLGEYNHLTHIGALDFVTKGGALAAYPTQADHDLELADLLGTVPGKLPRYPDSRLGKGTIPP